MENNNLHDLYDEIKRIQSERKPNTNVYKYSDKLTRKAKKALDYIERNNNNSWALFMFERNVNSMDKTAIKYRGNKISYEEMYSKVFEYCKSLKALGVKKGDQVPVCISNIPEYIYLLLACSFIGATIHLVGSWFDKNNLKNILNNTNSKIMFISEDYYEKIMDVVEESDIQTPILISLEDSLMKNREGKPFNPYQDIDGENHVFTSRFNEFKGKSIKNVINQKEFIERGAEYKGNVLESTTLDDVATITYTSGTTEKGCPKGVKHSNRVYITSSRFKLADVSGMPEMKDLTALYEIPVYSHTNVSNVADTLCCNCTYASEPFKETNFFLKSLLINKPHYCQSTIGRWLFLGKELSKEANKKIKFPYLIMCDVAGEGCSIGEEKFLNRMAKEHKFGTKKLPFPLSPVTFSMGGGTCEAGGVFTTLFHEFQQGVLSALYARKYSLGIIPFNMIEYEILNHDGDYCALNEPGLLVVNSPTSFSGYTDEQIDPSAYVFDKYGKKWINMGTLAYKSDERAQSIKMKGREKDFVILKDGTFFPIFKIEESISKDTKNIMSCTVIKTDDNVYVCHIEKQPNSSKRIEDVLSSCALRLEKEIPEEIFNKIYFRVRSYEEGFPISKSGKRDFNSLRSEKDYENMIYVEDAITKSNNQKNNMVLRLTK